MQAVESIIPVRERVVPQGVPAWITAEVIEDTLRTFQPFYPYDLTVDEAVGILLNVGNLFRVLKGEQHAEIQTEGGSEELDEP